MRSEVPPEHLEKPFFLCMAYRNLRYGPDQLRNEQMGMENFYEPYDRLRKRGVRQKPAAAAALDIAIVRGIADGYFEPTDILPIGEKA